MRTTCARSATGKERRVDPQIIVGLLVDRGGSPLQVGCWEGDRAETTTIIPVVEAFQAAHGIEELVVALMPACSRRPTWRPLDEARLRFIVGARQVRSHYLVGGLGWSGAGPVAVGTGVLPLSSNDPGGESHLRQPGAGDR